MSVIPARVKLKQKDHEFRVNLDYTGRGRASLKKREGGRGKKGEEEEEEKEEKAARYAPVQNHQEFLAVTAEHWPWLHSPHPQA